MSTLAFDKGSRENLGKLTQKLVHDIEAGAAKRRLPDHEVKGLFLRVLPSGAKTYVLRYSIGPRRGEAAIGDARAVSLAFARKKALELLGDMAVRDLDPALAKREAAQAVKRQVSETLESLAEAYFADGVRRKRPKTLELERFIFRRHILPEFGGMAYADIRRANMIALIEKVGATSGPISANRTHAQLRQVLNFAVSRGLLDANPALSVPRLFPEKSRDRVLNETELRRLWAMLELARQGEGPGMSRATALALQVTLLTLQRSGEVAGIRENEISWDDRVWVCPADRMKGKRPHAVPLSDLALERLREAFAISRSDIAFPGRDGQAPLEQKRLSRAMARACAQLKIPSAGPHDLRRTGRTMLTSERIGVSYETAERVIAHLVGSAVSRVYDRNQYLGEKRAALEVWAREVARVAEP